MKRRIFFLLLTFMALFSLVVSAGAAEQTGAQLNYVTDAAGLFSEGENAQLEKWRKRFQRNTVSVFMP